MGLQSTLPHKSTHATGSADALTLSDIGAFQPSPEYAADNLAHAQVSGFDGQPTAIFSRVNANYYQGDNIDYYIQRDGQSHGGVAGSWILFNQPSDVAEGIMVALSTTATTYPWQAAWTDGVTVVKAALPRIVGAPLAATAAEGTSAYAARADHVHPFPTASQVGAAPAGNYVTLDGTGKVPSTQLPSYVDDVLEYATLSALQADTTARVSSKIYVVLNTGKIYRWSGSVYVEISNTLELVDLQIPDPLASVYAIVPFFNSPELPLTGTLNGKPRYTGSFDGDNYDVYWTGTNWKATGYYSADGESYGESIATGNTQYPWQATGWTNGGSVTRFRTYDAALAPLPLAAEASSGTGTKAAREDHVHPLPTPEDIGAVKGFEISGNPPNPDIAPAAMELRDNEDPGGVVLKCDGALYPQDNPWSVSFSDKFCTAIGAATAEQGAKADTALQSDALAIVFKYRGGYDTSGYYKVNDVVTEGGAFFLCKFDITPIFSDGRYDNQGPSGEATYWAPFAPHTAADGVRSIAGGGTGATTAISALTNLGAVGSNITGLTDATQLSNIVQITQAGYNLIGTPNANTLYVIVG